LCPMS